MQADGTALDVAGLPAILDCLQVLYSADRGGLPIKSLRAVGPDELRQVRKV